MQMLTLSEVGRSRFALAPTIVAVLRRVAGALGHAVTVALRWQERAAQRRRLAELNDHMLRDIGLDRGQVWRESAKPFWRG